MNKIVYRIVALIPAILLFATGCIEAFAITGLLPSSSPSAFRLDLFFAVLGFLSAALIAVLIAFFLINKRGKKSLYIFLSSSLSIIVCGFSFYYGLYRPTDGFMFRSEYLIYQIPLVIMYVSFVATAVLSIVNISKNSNTIGKVAFYLRITNYVFSLFTLISVITLACLGTFKSSYYYVTYPEIYIFIALLPSLLIFTPFLHKSILKTCENTQPESKTRKTFYLSFIPGLLEIACAALFSTFGYSSLGWAISIFGSVFLIVYFLVIVYLFVIPIIFKDSLVNKHELALQIITSVVVFLFFITNCYLSFWPILTAPFSSPYPTNTANSLLVIILFTTWALLLVISIVRIFIKRSFVNAIYKAALILFGVVLVALAIISSFPTPNQRTYIMLNELGLVAAISLLFSIPILWKESNEVRNLNQISRQ